MTKLTLDYLKDKGQSFAQYGSAPMFEPNDIRRYSVVLAWHKVAGAFDYEAWLDGAVGKYTNEVAIMFDLETDLRNDMLKLVEPLARKIEADVTAYNLYK